MLDVKALLLTLVGCMALPGLAWAQNADLQLAPSPATQCLTPGPAERGEPEYPFAPWKRGEGGRVLVDLTFGGPELAPAVDVVQASGDSELVAAVKRFVGSFRVPCMTLSEAPVRLRQEYVFEPDRRRAIFGQPVDLADAARREQMRCVATPTGTGVPDYPMWARREGLQGNVLALLRFIGPDLPPQVQVYAGSRRLQRLADDVVPWLAALRMPCHRGGPISTTLTLMFRLEGDPPFGFRNVTFRQFLGSVKGIKEMNVNLNTQDMGCPFAVQLRYFQPYASNAVGQVGSIDPRRQPLLDWLATLTLDLREPQLDSVLGDTLKLTIPCVRIQLDPKEKS